MGSNSTTAREVCTDKMRPAGHSVDVRAAILRSIQRKNAVILARRRVYLCGFAQQAIADGQRFDFGAHETAKGGFGSANDGFAADVETGVHQHRATGSA